MNPLFEVVGTGIVRCPVCKEYLLWNKPLAYGVGKGNDTQLALQHLATHNLEKTKNGTDQDYAQGVPLSQPTT